MAVLSKDCVDDNWKQRPDMSEVVLRLSQILVSCEEWDKQLLSQTESRVSLGPRLIETTVHTYSWTVYIP